MARKKSAETTETAQISFKCPADLKSDLEELAYMSRRDVSSLLVEAATELIKANRKEIACSRRRKPYQVKLPTFVTAPNPDEPAQVIDAGTASDTSDKGGEIQ